MQTREDVFGTEHPCTLTSRGNLAATYRNQKEVEESRRAGDISYGNEKEGYGMGVSRYADQHGQLGIDILESRTVGRDRRIASASYEDE